MTSYHILDDTLHALIVGGEVDPKRYLMLEWHPTLPMQWKVESFDATYLAKLEGVVSPYATVTPFGFSSFLERATEQGFEVVFLEDPSETLEWLGGLSGPTETVILSDHLELATGEGFLPFQAQGINFAKLARATYYNWSTGTGKSVGAAGLIAWYVQHAHVDLVLYFVKPHNKINTKRSLEKLVGLESTIVDGTPKKREQQYIEVARRMNAGSPAILVSNYEKLRDDTEAFTMLVEGRRVLVIWDEMSSKMGNHTTGLYKGAAEVLYTSHTTRAKTVRKGDVEVEVRETLFYPLAGKERTAECYHVAMSATPIEHNPSNWFNQIRMMDSSIYGTRQEFEAKFVRGRDPWGNPKWNSKKLPLIGAMASHIIHQVDKRDPDIACQFPEVLPEEVIDLELSKPEQRLYDKLVSEYQAFKDQDPSILDDTDILAAINVLQGLCSNPMAVLESARSFQAWLDSGGDPRKRQGSQVAWKLREQIDDDSKFEILVPTKLLWLQETLEVETEKLVVFTSMNDTLIPYISRHLDKLKVSHVTYHGGLNGKQKQEAEDRFQEDPSCRVFLSSDAGSDSINLHAAADVLHYDLPWSWAKKVQRFNRVNRIISEHAVNRERSLETLGTVEGRKREVVQEKEGWHEGILGGDINTQAQQIRRGDYLYILLGS